MKVVILAGGLGTRLAEETEIKPKPMIEIGGQPILWHIMKHYAHYGFNEFVIALGYRGETIKRFFLDYANLRGNVSIDLATGKCERDCFPVDDNWTIHLRDTGLNTNTGGRLKRLQPLLDSGSFMLTYGDGLCDLDLCKALEFHRQHGRIATVTAVRPPSRFGGLTFDGDLVKEFSEKPQIGEGWINGGFLVLQPAVFDYIKGDDTSLEADTLEQLAAEGQLAAYRHQSFWHCMDTLRDKRQLETMWREGRPAWKVWD